jgi:hypothetical protein
VWLRLFCHKKGNVPDQKNFFRIFCLVMFCGGFSVIIANKSRGQNSINAKVSDNTQQRQMS